MKTTTTHLEDLRGPLSNARKCLAILLEAAPLSLADIPVTEMRPTESDLPESGLLGWVNAGEMICKTLAYLSHAQDEADGVDRYIDELLAKASAKPAASPASQKQPEDCSTEVRSDETVHVATAKPVALSSSQVQPEASPSRSENGETGSTPESNLKLHTAGFVQALMNNTTEPAAVVGVFLSVLEQCQQHDLLCELKKRMDLDPEATMEINGIPMDLGHVLFVAKNAVDSHADDASRLLLEAIGHLGGAITCPHKLSTDSYETSMQDAIHALAGVQANQKQLIDALDVVRQWKEGTEASDDVDASDNDHTSGSYAASSAPQEEGAA